MSVPAPSRLGLRTGLVIAFLVPALVIWTLASWATREQTRALLDAQVGDGLVAVAATAASQISAERVLAIQPGDDVAGLRSWTHLSQQLETLRAQAGLRRALVVDLQGRVLVDTGSIEADHPSVPPLPVGVRVAELSQDLAELAQVRDGTPTASLVTFRGLDGSDYRRGYAPLLGLEDTVVGVVAVEGSARTFSALRRHALEATLWGLLVALTLGIAALLVAAGMGRPFRRLRDAARRIGGGDLSTPVTPERRLSELAEVSLAMESMRRELEARDRQLKMMLAGVAHEVRNPLGGMELFGGLLAEELEQQGSDEARAHLARIRKEIGYLSRIVSDFLSFARERTIHPVEVEATEWLEHARSLLAATAEARGVAIALEVAEGTLEADRELLTAAMVNLLQNALQASEAEHTVHVVGAHEGTQYVVRVRDAGPGIPAEVQAQIFEPFFTTREQGTGLGLPLTRKIVEAHGGTLTVTSVPGDTCFTLRLPCRIADRATSAA